MQSSTKTCHNDVFACCGCCFGCLFVLAAVAACIAWMVFAIMALVNEEDTNFDKLCNCDSHLWAYLLTIVIWNGVFAQQCRASTTDKETSGFIEKLIAHALSLMIDIGLVVWGWVELYHADSASTLNNLNTYKMSSYWVYAHTTLLGLSLIAAIGVLIYMFHESKNTSDPVDSLERGSQTTVEEVPTKAVVPTVHESASTYTSVTSPRRIATT